MPRLWRETLDAHRRDVRDAVIAAATELAAERGLRGVTMSQVADLAGIGRATLYKYFPDVEAILVAWHEQQIADHLAALHDAASKADDPGERIEMVLAAYARIIHDAAARHHGTDLAALVHRDEHLNRAQHQVAKLMQGLLADGIAAGKIRDDVSPAELAAYCLSALSAARAAPSHAAADRLVIVTLSGLHPR